MSRGEASQCRCSLSSLLVCAEQRGALGAKVDEACLQLQECGCVLSLGRPSLDGDHCEGVAEENLVRALKVVMALGGVVVRQVHRVRGDRERARPFSPTAAHAHRLVRQLAPLFEESEAQVIALVGAAFGIELEEQLRGTWPLVLLFHAHWQAGLLG